MMIVRKEVLMQIHQMETMECQAKLQQCTQSYYGTNGGQRCQKDGLYIKCLENLNVTAARFVSIEDAIIRACDQVEAFKQPPTAEDIAIVCGLCAYTPPPHQRHIQIPYP